MMKRLNRRGFLRLFVGRRTEELTVYLRPPGAAEGKLFSTLCDGCGDCAESCPHRSIKMDLGSPIIIPKDAPCYLCQDFPCIQACKTGALRAMRSREQIKMGTAVINRTGCSAWDGGDCRFCFIKCPLSDEALYLEDFKPVVREERCTVCGACEHICATVNDRAPMKVIPRSLSNFQI